MSSSYQPVPFEYIDDQLPPLISHQSSDFGNEFSFLDLETADPAAFFEPFEHSGIDSQPVTFDEPLQKTQYPLQGLLPEIDVVTQLSDLSLLNIRLQQRVNELDAICGKVQDKNVADRPQWRRILANDS